jgi:hypothetical protein
VEDRVRRKDRKILESVDDPVIKYDRKPGTKFSDKSSTMVSKNPHLRFLASRVTRTVYHQHDRVVIWRGQFRGESGSVITTHGKKMRVRLLAPDERVRRLTTGGVVVVFKTSCCLVA